MLYARPEGARDPLLEQLMSEANLAQQCPFCMLDPRQKLITTPGKHWQVFHRLMLPPGESLHIILAAGIERYERPADNPYHVLDFHQLPMAARAEFMELIVSLTERFGIDSSALLVRLGRPEHNSATVFHLHAHLIVSDGEPVQKTAIPEDLRPVVDQIMLMAAFQDEPPLEWINRLREALDAERSRIQGHAHPIRVKLSGRLR